MSREQARWPGDSDRVAIVLPGLGYNPDMPLLYWTAKVLNQVGWTIQQLWWPEPFPTDPSALRGWVASRTAEALDRESTADQLLLVGKSLGSLAVPLAAERALLGIWLTPLLANQPELRDILTVLPPSLLVAGTADPSWDETAAAASGHEVCEVEGADHSIEIDGDALASLDALGRVLTAIDGYARRRR